MKLSSREKTLLIILAVIVFGFFYYKFIFVPQSNQLKEAKQKLSELRQISQDIENYNDPQGAIKKQYDEMQQNITAAAERYFPDIIQERIIRITDELLKVSALNGKVLEFSKISDEAVLVKTEKSNLQQSKKNTLQTMVNRLESEKAPSNQAVTSGSVVVETMQELVEYSDASYFQIVEFMKAVETFQKEIVIESVKISSSESGNLQGSINLHFYGIPKMFTDKDSWYLNWDIFDVYGRTNPYQP